ncbi:MAG: PKD domain-containing protein [Bacteroidota bacterium]
MKKALFILFFWALVHPMMALNYMTISGTVFDSVTGAPVPNHPVTIMVDSASGFSYYNVVNTFMNGFYVDTIFFNGGMIPSGLLTVSTPECNNQQQVAYFQFGPGNLFFGHNFYICTGGPPPCQADFSWQAQPNSLTVQFVNQSTGSPNFSSTWNFGDGGSSYIKDPVHTYTQPGLYNVMLTISDSGMGCWNTEVKMIQVGDSTGGGCHANFYAEPDSGNQMNLHFFDQSQGSNISSWFWDFQDGSTSTLQNPVHLFTQPGNYHVCLTIRSSDSLCFDTGCEEIYVGNNNGCQAQFTWFPDSLNNGGTTLHFVDLSLGGGATWFWSFGDSTYSTLPNPSHTFPHEGIYHVCLTITGNNPACQSTWCADVNIGNQQGCANYFAFSQNQLNVAFEGEMVNHHMATYNWSFGDGATGFGKNTTHQYPAPGVYYVTLTSTEENTLCVSTSGQSIQVGDSGQYNQIYGQVFAGNFPLAEGMAMIFSLDGPNTLPFFAVSIIDSMGIYSFPYVPQGNFVIWAIPANITGGYLPTYYGDVLTWQAATVISLGTPSNPYNIHLIPATNANIGSGNIMGQINGGDAPLTMLDKVRMILMNEQGQTLGFVNVNASGAFDFGHQLAYGVYFLRAELPGIPSDLIRIEITASQPVANVIMTYNGTNLLGISDPVTVVENFMLSPNPVQDVISIKMTMNQNVQIQIGLTDFSGRQVMNSEKLLQKGLNEIRMDATQLQQGMYILRIRSSEGLKITQKLIKSN